VERRVRPLPDARLGAKEDDGWLVFSAIEDKRRLAPIPSAWDRLPDSELESLCQHARVAPSSPARRS
jgi:hypothetical protein